MEGIHYFSFLKRKKNLSLFQQPENGVTLPTALKRFNHTTFQKTYLMFALFLLFFSFLKAKEFTKTQDDPYRNAFIENKGQITNEKGMPQPDILFAGKLNGVKYYIYKDGIHFYTDPNKNLSVEKQVNGKGKEIFIEGQNEIINFLNRELVNSNRNPLIETKKQSSYFYNYYYSKIGKPITNVRTYEEVIIKEVYPKIDIRYYLKDNKLAYDFLVHSGADISNIKMKYHVNGQSSVSNTNSPLFLKNGKIIYKTAQISMEESAPISFIKGSVGIEKKIGSKYVSLSQEGDNNVENTYGFSAPEWDGKSELRIDPIWTWGTFYGGNNDILADVVAWVDNSGSTPKSYLYSTGWSYATTGIVTSGSFTSIHANSAGTNSYNADGFINKWDKSASGTSQLVWATYYNGDGSQNINYFDGSNMRYGSRENPYAITCNNLGEVYIGGLVDNGKTFSSTYSASSVNITKKTTTSNNYLNQWDMFILGLNKNGAFISDTYFGASDKMEHLFDITCDPTSTKGDVYLTGNTLVTTPLNSGPYNLDTGTYKLISSSFSYSNGILLHANMKDPNSSFAIYAVVDRATYVQDGEFSYGTAVKFFNNSIYVTGQITTKVNTTSNKNLGLATAGAYQSVPSIGTTDYGFNSFICKFSKNLKNLQKGTYYGSTAQNREISDIEVIDPNNVVIYGRVSNWINSGTMEINIMIDIGKFDFNVTGSGQFILLKQQSLNSMTVGNIQLSPNKSEIYFSASTSTTGLATSCNLGTGLSGAKDAIWGKVDITSKAINQLSYFGGSGSEGKSAIALDNLGNIYLAGNTNTTSATGYTTGTPYSSSYNDIYYEDFEIPNANAHNLGSVKNYCEIECTLDKSTATSYQWYLVDVSTGATTLITGATSSKVSGTIGLSYRCKIGYGYSSCGVLSNDVVFPATPATATLTDLISAGNYCQMKATFTTTASLVLQSFNWYESTTLTGTYNLVYSGLGVAGGYFPAIGGRYYKVRAFYWRLDSSSCGIWANNNIGKLMPIFGNNFTIRALDSLGDFCKLKATGSMNNTCITNYQWMDSTAGGGIFANIPRATDSQIIATDGKWYKVKITVAGITYTSKKFFKNLKPYLIKVKDTTACGTYTLKVNYLGNTSKIDSVKWYFSADSINYTLKKKGLKNLVVTEGGYYKFELYKPSPACGGTGIYNFKTRAHYLSNQKKYICGGDSTILSAAFDSTGSNDLCDPSVYTIEWQYNLDTLGNAWPINEIDTSAGYSCQTYLTAAGYYRFRVKEKLSNGSICTSPFSRPIQFFEDKKLDISPDSLAIFNGGLLSVKKYSRPYYDSIKWYNNDGFYSTSLSLSITTSTEGIFYTTGKNRCGNRVRSESIFVGHPECAAGNGGYDLQLYDAYSPITYIGGIHNIVPMSSNLLINKLILASGTNMTIQGPKNMIFKKNGYIHVGRSSSLTIKDMKLTSCSVWNGIEVDTDGMLILQNCEITRALIAVAFHGRSISEITSSQFYSNNCHIYITSLRDSANVPRCDIKIIGNKFRSGAVLDTSGSGLTTPTIISYKPWIYVYGSNLFSTNMGALNIRDNLFLGNRTIPMDERTSGIQFAQLGFAATDGMNKARQNIIKDNSFEGPVKAGIVMNDGNHFDMENISIQGGYGIGIDAISASDLNLIKLRIGSDTSIGNQFPNTGITASAKNFRLTANSTDTADNNRIFKCQKGLELLNFATAYHNNEVSKTYFKGNFVGLAISPDYRFIANPVVFVEASTNPIEHAYRDTMKISLYCNSFRDNAYGIIGQGNLNVLGRSSATPYTYKDMGNQFYDLNYSNIQFDILWSDSGYAKYYYNNSIAITKPNNFSRTGNTLIGKLIPMNYERLSSYSQFWKPIYNTINIKNNTISPGISRSSFPSSFSSAICSVRQFNKRTAVEETVKVGVDIIKLFPNTSTQMVTFESELGLVYDIKIIDMAGKIIMSMPNTTLPKQVDVEGLAHGLYNVLFINHYSGEVAHKSLQKN